jgi:hypothetical protein
MISQVDVAEVGEVTIKLLAVETCFLVQLLLIDHGEAQEVHDALTDPEEITASQRMLDTIKTVAEKINRCLFDETEILVAAQEGRVH